MIKKITSIFVLGLVTLALTACDCEKNVAVVVVKVIHAVKQLVLLVVVQRVAGSKILIFNNKITFISKAPMPRFIYDPVGIVSRVG